MSVQMDFGDGLAWRKSVRSGDNGGACVYVARHGRTGMIGVRDSKQGAAGSPQWHTPAAWEAFLATVRAGEFAGI